MRAGQLTTAGSRRTRATEIARTLVTRAQPPDASETGADPPGDPPGDPEGPIILERYRLRRRLGTGGFGSVWMARDERLQRDVAVKILPRELVSEGRFEREAHAAARLSHPGIVTLYEAAADDEGAYLVSELVRGATLQRALAVGRLSDRGIIEVGIAVCDALRHAHAHGVVHRDVKPSNILIPSNSPARSKLTDFGVARLLGGDTLTRTGDLIGTEAYMAPEQAEGREAGEPADLFSLALVVYEALTGVNPVSLATGGAGARRARRLAQHLPPLRRQRRDLPRELGQAIDLALRPRPRERGTVDSLRAALARACDLVSDQPGVVHDAWPSRSASATQDRRPPGAPADRRTRREAAVVPVREPASVPTRAGGAAAAAGLAAWVVGRVLASAPLPAASAALLAALAVVLLPRLGWIVLCGAAVVLLSVQGRPGAALVLGLGALLPAVSLPGAGSAWPLAAGAPFLGVIGLAGAWPALAARARGNWRRAMLGGVGWAWVLLGGALTGRALYAPRPASSPQIWDSLAQTWHQALAPIAPAGVVAGALVWGLGALVLPVVTRRAGRARAVVICAWAAAVAAGTGIALRLAGAGALAPSPGRFLAGLGACAAIALIPPASERLRSRRDTDQTAARLA
jgi:eukaryotic-like serine/threonine-protein kinase